jgi:hypothetical protein
MESFAMHGVKSHLQSLGMDRGVETFSMQLSEDLQKYPVHTYRYESERESSGLAL